MREVKHWHRLSRKVVNTPTLETFTDGSDGALSNLTKFQMFLLTAGGPGLVMFKGSFQLKLFYDSMILSVHGRTMHIPAVRHNLGPACK